MVITSVNVDFNIKRVTLFSMVYTQPTEEFRNQFFSLVAKARSIIITSHTNPDDDSISSVLASYSILTTRYPDKRVRMMYSSSPETRWSYFEHFQDIVFIPDITQHFEDADLLLVVDCGQYNRFTPQPAQISSFHGTTICVDHHETPPDAFNLTLIAIRSVSTTQLIHALLWDVSQSLPERLAQTFYLGINGDTGNFRYNVNPQKATVFDFARMCVIQGNITVEDFNAQYTRYSLPIFRLMQEFIKNADFRSIKNWPQCSYSFITHAFIQQHTYSEEDVKAAATIYLDTFSKSLQGISWGFVIYPYRGILKVSFRSLAKGVNVRLIAEQFRGGGHNQASGATFSGEEWQRLPIEDALQNFFTWMEQREPFLL